MALNSFHCCWKYVCCYDEDKIRDLVIGKSLRRSGRNKRKLHKLLLLGSSKSGKSTFVKQIRYINDKKDFEDNLKNFLPQIRENVLTIVYTLINEMDFFGLSFDDEMNENSADKAKDVFEEMHKPEAEEVLVTDILEDIVSLVHDNGIQEVIKRRPLSFSQIDSADYYIAYDNLYRICSPEYSPTVDDVLHCRVETFGINKYHVKMKNESTSLDIIDVGGTERKKWFHVFDDATSVIFFVSLCDYCEIITDELGSINKLDDTKNLFKLILNNPYLADKSFILFLNKIDRFETAINKIDLVDFHKAYDGPRQDHLKARKFICRMFLEQNQKEDQQIFYHFTCATDRGNIRVIYDAVKATIFNDLINSVGLV